MKEKVVWEVLTELNARGFTYTDSIRPEILREVIVQITGVFDKGTTTRNIQSLLDADVLRADFGVFKYGFYAKKILVRLGLLDDPELLKSLKPRTELNDKLKTDIITHSSVDLPDLPEKYVEDYKKLKKEVSDGKTDNAV